MRPIAILFALALALPAGKAAAQQASTMTMVADGVYHYFGMRYSSLVVIGEDGVLVTDTAFTPRAMDLKAQIEKITDLPVRYVALSHEHFDHAGGTEVFADAQVVCHSVCESVFATSLMFPMPQVDISYSDRMSIDLGGKTVELSQPAPGDGIGTTVFWVPEDRVVFSADMYNHRRFIFPEFKEDTNFLGVLTILETIDSWNPAYAIEGHMPGNSLPALRENLAMFTELRDVVLARLTKAWGEGGPGATFPLLFSLPGEVKLDRYSEWEGYDTAFPAYVRRMALAIFHGG